MRSSFACLTVRIARLRGWLTPNQPDHVDLGENDQTVLQHALDFPDRLVEFLGCVHYRDHDREIARERKLAAFVSVAFHAVAENTPIHSRARDLQNAQPVHDGIVERFALPPVRLSEIDAHHACLAAYLAMRRL